MNEMYIWIPSVIISVVLVYGVVIMRKQFGNNAKPKEVKKSCQEISLQVPDSVNLKEMSTKEIEKLALELSRKAAAGLPPETILAAERVTMTNKADDIAAGFGIGWGRSCDSGELDRDILINPAVFENKVQDTLNTGNISGKVTIEQKL